MEFRIIKTERFESFIENGVFKMKYGISDWIVVFIFTILPIVGGFIITKRFVEVGLFLVFFGIIVIISMPMLYSSKVTITLEDDVIHVYYKDREVKSDLVIMEDGYYDFSSEFKVYYVDGGSLSLLGKYSVYVCLKQVLMILRGTECLSAFREVTTIE